MDVCYSGSGLLEQENTFNESHKTCDVYYVDVDVQAVISMVLMGIFHAVKDEVTFVM